MTKNKKIIWISSAALATALVVGGTGVAVASTTGDEEAVSGRAFDRASEVALNETGAGIVERVETGDDADHAYEVDVRLENGSDIEVELDDNFGVVRTEADEADSTDDANDVEDADNGRDSDSDDRDDQSDSDDADDRNDSDDRNDDAPVVALTDAERASASSAAVAEIGDGTVTEIERSDDAGHAFEVEITFADGTDVDVELDASFAVTYVDR